MTLLYADKSTPRLQYIAAFIFKEVLKVPYSITTHKQGFIEFVGIKINYSNKKVSDNELIVPNHGLLFETGIKQQIIEVTNFQEFKIFFQSPSQNNNEFPFDIFSAGFYLLCRYEEYLPHKKDKYGRYSFLNSLAYKENFLHRPLINIWIDYFKNYLSDHFRNISTDASIQQDSFSFIPTYDVDIAFAYLHKTSVKKSTGILRSILKLNFKKVKQQLKVLSNSKQDPFYSFDWLDTIHQANNLKPIYFFLVPEKNGVYDKNTLPQKEAMIELIRNQSEKYSLGLHPSWQSGDDFSLLEREKKILETICGSVINKSRHHYLRFNLPLDYRRLSEAGITEDYTMGYGASNGFRASVASSFMWYDLEKEQQANLRIYPFCYMDSTTIFHKRLSYDEAYNEILSYYTICKDVKGMFISIFHNHLLGDDNLQWRNVYEQFLKKNIV